ncbi:hypothetical protein PTKIN_Ptkin05aG0223700 [Pterospermum kingtungense]
MAEDLSDLWKVLKLTEDEDDTINANISINQSVKPEGEDWLVGSLLTTHPFNKEAMMATMKIIWKLSKEVEILALEDNIFLFKFQCAKDKERILEGAPWSFDKNLLLFHEFVGEWRPEEYKFEKATFWVRINNLPLGLRNANTREII